MLEELNDGTQVQEGACNREVTPAGEDLGAGEDPASTQTAEEPPGCRSDRDASGPAQADAAAEATPAVDVPVFVTPVLGDDIVEDGDGPADEEGGESPPETAKPWTDGVRPPNLRGARRGKRLVKKGLPARKSFTPDQRLLLLDTWQRSGLPAGDFAELVGVSKHTLYAWKKRFEDQGPAGLVDQPRGSKRGSRLPEVTRRAILMLKQGNPDYGCQRISDMLFRGPGLPAGPGAVSRVLHEAGYELKEVPARRHRDKVRRFERAKPNQLWQTDIFTFILKRQNRRVYLVAFMDDHSRFIVGYGLHASASTALVLEVLRAAVSSYGTPEEILTDNGSQYVTWRGKSAFTKECEKRGIKQIVASPRRPRTLGKIERFWGTLWRECVEASVFLDLGDARTRIGLFIDHYNFERTHSGIERLVPADRFFGAAPEVLETLKKRVAANALEIARNGMPKEPFYLTGNVGGRPFSVHAEGERLLLKRGDGESKEIELVPPKESEEKTRVASGSSSNATRRGGDLPEHVCPAGVVGEEPGKETPGYEEPPAPGTSPLDEGLKAVNEALAENDGGDR